MREIDRVTTERFGTTSLTLMHGAAAATARAVVEQFDNNIAGKGVLVLCGSGNNGGDGASAGRELAMQGAHVEIVLLGRVEDTRGDARTNFEIVQHLASDGGRFTESDMSDVAAFTLFSGSGGSVLFHECASDEDWDKLLYNEPSQPHDAFVDAVFGTGLNRPVAGVRQTVIRFLNRVRALRDVHGGLNPIISIDVPSGLNSDSAEPIGDAVHADVTVTMTAPKIANVLPPASNYNGRLIVADIGSPAELISESETNLFLTEEADARRWLIETRYQADSYKNTHGHAVIVAGSRGFTGAAALCGDAAMRAGAGLVTVATPASTQPLVATQVMPEVMTAALAETDRGAISDEAIDFFSKFSERADVVAVGPGISSEDDRTKLFVRRVVENRRTPLVIDADGLNCLSPWPPDLRGSAELPIVLTPHPGEMLRLMGTSDKSALDNRVEVARRFAIEHKVIVLLKGGRSLIAAPDGRVFVNSTGNAGQGTAGAGDTLTGVVTGFLAQALAYKPVADRSRISSLDTVIAALYVSGLAGDFAAREIGMRSMVASDIREHLGAAIRSLDPRGEQPT